MEQNPSPQKRIPFYTPQEEVANIITHGLGAVLSMIGLPLLIWLALDHGDIWRIISFSIYGCSLVAMYCISTLYHAMKQPERKHTFRILDHSAIYFLIAGSYTPFALVSLRNPLGISILTTVWILAVIGIIFKFYFVGRYSVIGTVGYILMGWLSVFAIKPLFDVIGMAGMMWLFAGGAIYSIGVIFFAWQKLPYNHAVWHLFVVGGSVCHFLAIVLHVLPTTT